VNDIDRTTPAVFEHWHSLSAEDALAQLGSARTGLTADEARQRLARFGPNRLAPPRTRGPLLRFALQFHNVLISSFWVRLSLPPVWATGWTPA
jgi:magnesium-transporting ATPase (P-type)